jgi:hypothetical protein
MREGRFKKVAPYHAGIINRNTGEVVSPFILQQRRRVAQAITQTVVEPTPTELLESTSIIEPSVQ